MPQGLPYPAPSDYERMLLREDPCEWESDGAADPEGRCTERHLQCVWYSDRLRPEIVTDAGESVAIESCGRWNLEAGPDFIDAVLLVGEERRKIVGDVELHLRPSGWTSHGHAGDVRYANVVLHVTYYPGPRPVDLPDGVLTASLRGALRAAPKFSFDDIDISAYPHAVIPGTPRPCRAAWGGDPDRAIAILRAAGLYRMEVKRRRMRAELRETGDGLQVLFKAVMGALGYKRNAQAMRLVAAALPLARWTGDVTTDFARLLGVAGLLPEIPPADDPREPLVRRLWDCWWKNGADVPAPPIAWSFDGVRPQNHPVRRLAAAAALFSHRDELSRWLDAVDFDNPRLPRLLPGRIGELAAYPEMEPFTSLSGKPGKGRPMALLGAARAAAIATNALVPYLAALHPRKATALFGKLPPETTSAPMRAMADRLFGPDHNPRVLYEGDGLLQQGLLQIYGDFCLSCRADCAECAFGSGRKFF